MNPITLERKVKVLLNVFILRLLSATAVFLTNGISKAVSESLFRMRVQTFLKVVFRPSSN